MSPVKLNVEGHGPDGTTTLYKGGDYEVALNAVNSSIMVNHQRLVPFHHIRVSRLRHGVEHLLLHVPLFTGESNT